MMLFSSIQINIISHQYSQQAFNFLNQILFDMQVLINFNIFKQINSKRRQQKKMSSAFFSKDKFQNYQKEPFRNTFTNSFDRNNKFQSSNSSIFRATSPSGNTSKTKIKLVSPFKDKINNNNKLPENNQFNKTHKVSNAEQAQKNLVNVQLGGKVTAKLANNSQQNRFLYISHSNNQKSSFQTIVHPNYTTFKRSVPYTIVQTRPITIIQPQRIASPNKVCINNKSFDVSSIKSKIVYVAPLKKDGDVSPLLKHSKIAHPICPSQLVIQQQNTIEDLKQSYETQMKEIKQLQRQIQDNNIQIKQLLKSSSASRQINTSRISQKIEKIENQQANLSFELISEKPVNNSLKASKENISQSQKIQVARGEISVQTDENQYGNNESLIEKNDSRHYKFSISKNNECQVQVIGVKGVSPSNQIINQSQNQYTFSNDYQVKQQENKSHLSIKADLLKNSLKSSKEKNITTVFLQQDVHEEIIPVSQQKLEQKCSQSVNLNTENLKISRAETQKSIIKANTNTNKVPTENIILSQTKVEQVKNSDKSLIQSNKKQLTSRISQVKGEFDKKSQKIQTKSERQKTAPVVSPSAQLTSDELKKSNISSISAGKRRINNSIYL